MSSGDMQARYDAQDFLRTLSGLLTCAKCRFDAGRSAGSNAGR